MGITLATNFTSKLNSVLPLAQSSAGLAVRVVSQGTDTIGTLTASGLQGTATWSILGNAPSWVSLTASSSSATLSYAGAQYQQDPYEFFVSCTDGVSTANFPIFMEVKDPFTVAANTSNPVVVNGTTLNISSYDSTVADVQIQGYGLYDAQQSNVSFILPSGLPTGLNYVTSNGGALKLRVSEPHYQGGAFASTDLIGGLQLYTSSPVAKPLTIQAYQPGSFYDNPDRTYPLTLSISSQLQKSGILDFGVGAYYDTINNVLTLDAEIDSLLGVLQSQGTEIAYPLKYQWSHSGALTGGDGIGTAKSTTYSIGATGAASVNLQVLDNNGLTVLNGLKTVNFNQLASSNTNWMTSTTTAFKVGVTSDKVFGSVGDTLTVTLSSPDGFSNGSTNETIYFTVNTEAASSIESSLNPIVTLSSASINTAAPTTTLTFKFPSGAAIGNKWTVKVAAGNDPQTPTRLGFAQVLFVCEGLPELTISGVSSTLNSSTGTNITPIQLLASNASSTPVTATFELVGGSEFGAGVLGAPDGLFINSQGQITGNAIVPGTYKFVVSATASGYRRSYSGIITMVVSQVAAPLRITAPTSTATSIQDNASFTISWGVSGNPSALYLAQIPGSTTIRTVTGAGSASVQQVGSSVYSVYGQSYYGWAYSVPLVVISSSIASATALLAAPTIATIDENYEITANWQPYSVNGGYTAYKGWNITLQTPPTTGSPVTVFTDGGLASGAGTPSARVFTEQLSSGDYSINMVGLSSDYTVALNSLPWDSSHTFPPALLSSNVTFDNTDLLLGQTLTVTLNANYAGANSWQVIFSDNTSTGWLPLTTRSVAKSFTTSGAQNIIVQTQNDFGTSNPPVKLRRQLTQQIYVVDQQYNPSAAAQGALTGTLGIGGESGFEIVDASTGVSIPQAYEVVVRAIARDTVTNELKLMVATSRFSNASSLLDTMAIDVFPITGRPHSKELLTPVYVIEANSATSSIPIKITTTTLPSNSYVGKPMQEFRMQATGGIPNYSWFAEGLPPGLKMNIDGTISGTPTQLGAFTVNFAVMDSSNPAYIDESTLVFTIPTDLKITTTSLPKAVVGTPYEQVITNTGGLAPYTWGVVAGSAPIGVVIDKNSGILGGVPCTYNSSNATGGDFASGKVFTFTVQVTDAIGAKASKNYSISLSPAALSFGKSVDQPTIIAGEAFKLTVPVYGGQSPYSNFTFEDNGIVGTGLNIVNPTQISVAGASTSTLAITSIDREVYPSSFPSNISFILAATGGVPSTSGVPSSQAYKFYVTSTTFSSAACYGPLLVAKATSNGTYQVTVNVIDAGGRTASKTLNITVQQQGSGQYPLMPYIVNTTSSTPSNWVFTSISALPDPIIGQAYRPSTYNGAYGSSYGVNDYFCYAVKDTGTGNPKISSGGGSSHPATFHINNGVFPSSIDPITNGDSFSGSTAGTADCVLILPGGTPTSAGGFSFELEVDGIINGSNAAVTTAQRFGLNIVSSNSTASTTAVAALLLPFVNDTTAIPTPTPTGELDIDLNRVGASGWSYPLIAEGGTAPYTFSIANGTTLPGVTTGVSINSLPAFSSSTTTTGNYVVNIVATDKNGVKTPTISIPVQIAQSPSQPIHILSNNIPPYVYVNRQIPVNTYYIESDLAATWTSSPQNINSGITVTTVPATRAYLQGTPTQSGPSAPIVFTATSATYGTTASVTVNLQVKAQAATIISPSHTGATATIGTQYRVVNNNAIIAVQYVGFQPGDSNLPVLVNTLQSATLGSPLTNSPNYLINGQLSTGIANVTADGFTMYYDYLPTGPGTDTLSFGNQSSVFTDTLNITEVYTALVATGTTVPVTVSEYTVTQTLSLPISISGGNSPYSINVTGVSDSRFVTVNNGTSSAALQITVNQFTSGSTYGCSVAMTVTDSSGNVASASGTINVTIKTEDFITVNFSDYSWPISLSAGNSSYIIPNQLMSVPQLGHAPYTYYVDSVTIPSGLNNFIQTSPTKRVLAYNETSSSVNIADVDAALTPNGNYNVTVGTEPSAGTYTIAVALRVVDSKNISSSATQHISVVISS